jgi:small-conductance mechanosensitive channel
MNQLLYEIAGWLAYLLRPVVLLQCLSCGLLVLGYLLGVRPRLAGHGRRVELIGAGGLWLALRLNSLLLAALGLPAGLALYITQIYAFWLLLSLVRLLLLQRLPEEPVLRFFNRIVQPLFVLFVLGSLVNQLASLQDVAEIPLFRFFDEPITTGSLFLLLIIPYFLVVVSEFPVVWLGAALQRLLGLSRGTRVAVELVCRYLLIGGGVLWLLHRIGLNGNAIAAIAGGLSVGLGFGIKEVFSNFVSGLWLLFEGSVRPGEILFIDGDACEVRSLGLRAAVVWRDRDNAELVIPNQDFFTTTTTTYTGTDRMRRSEVEVSAGYQHDPEMVIRVLEEVALSAARVLPQPAPKALLLSYGDSGINYGLRYWIANPMDNASIRSEVSSAVWHAFQRQGIEIPFPQRVLHQN